MSLREADMQTRLAQWLRFHHPDVLFHSDFGSGIRLTQGQAIKQKRQNGGKRGWPDMIIANPSVAVVDGVRTHYCGLFLELKKEGTRLHKKNGDWATPHIEEQAKVLAELRGRGYCAKFAVGFEEATEIITKYLGR